MTGKSQYVVTCSNKLFCCLFWFFIHTSFS